MKAVLIMAIMCIIFGAYVSQIDNDTQPKDEQIQHLTDRVDMLEAELIGLIQDIQ